MDTFEELESENATLRKELEKSDALVGNLTNGTEVIELIKQNAALKGRCNGLEEKLAVLKETAGIEEKPDHEWRVEVWALKRKIEALEKERIDVIDKYNARNDQLSESIMEKDREILRLKGTIINMSTKIFFEHNY